ncbi:YceI family protein [Flavobacterium piscis]|uniref:Polyisoprenoid-binding protein YceI n=1 Tax=Flavobacterium piscis TaxID=1114874 RepID=A0ABU1Y9R5_9FLAO|nr:YceI family protein [Flavobacterium piscis]MDR7210977.1 polyisoprenoid-binding protein YceI [Flavobacterium piscis]
MKNIILIAICLCFAITSLMAQNINTEKSVVAFEISNMKINTVKGTFNGMKGTVSFDPNSLNTSTFDVCIDASSVNTGNKKRDNHLRTEDFFDVEKYSSICFKSTQVIKSNQGYIAKGKLTLHGVSNDIEIPLNVTRKQFTGVFTIKRQDYKLGKNTGTFMVGEEAKITITCILK